MDAVQAPQRPHRLPPCGRRIGLELPTAADAEVAELAQREHRSKAGMTRMLVLEALNARRAPSGSAQ